MLLSNYLLSGGVKPYLEYGWVTAPNTAAQAITNNTITTLTIDTEIADTGNNGSISGNQITLNAGTYYFDVNTFFGYNGNYPYMVIMYLFNATTSTYISKLKQGFVASEGLTRFYGQFTISSSQAIEVRCMPKNNCFVGSDYNNNGDMTNSTAYADQRTTIKLWKLA